MTTRRRFITAAAGAGLLSATGCTQQTPASQDLGSPATPSHSGSIIFQIWDKAQEAAMNEIVAAFNRQYPRISVNVNVTAYASYWEKLRTQATGGDLPDVFWMNAPNVRLYAKHGKLQDLTELEGIDPANYPPKLTELYTVDERRYAVPKDFDTIALWYNRDLLHRAGVDEPRGSWSWEEFRTAAHEVTRALGAENIWGHAGGVETQAYAYPLVFQAGGKIISEDGRRSGYSDPATRRAFSFMRALIEDGITPDVRYTSENKPDELFSSGKAALMTSGNWTAAILMDSPQRKHLGVAPLPHGEKNANIIHGIGTVMSAGCRDKPAASAFLAFLGSQEANRIQAAAGAANPAFIGTNQAYIDALPEFSLQTFIDAAETALPFPASENTGAWNLHEKLLYPGIIGGLTGTSVAEGLAELTEKMNGVLADES